VIEENHSYAQVANNVAMPYLTSLLPLGTVFTQYFANTHPSIGNYFELTAGQIITNDDSFSGAVTAPNLARQLIADQKSWKVYAESLPKPGYVGGDVYPYAKHHNPFVYFSDVLNDPAQQQNIVPFSQFAADLSSGALPAFSLVIPNLNNDAHDCPAGMSACTDEDKLAAADLWLSSNIAAMLADSNFQNGSVLFITFDEGNEADDTNGGGHVFALAVGQPVKTGFQSVSTYQHQNLLSTVCAALQLSGCPGDGQSAAPMTDIFN
jgi:acid phosphatase